MKQLPCFGKPDPGETSITDEISDNTYRKYRTIEQDIKGAGPQMEGSAGQKSRVSMQPARQLAGFCKNKLFSFILYLFYIYT